MSTQEREDKGFPTEQVDSRSDQVTETWTKAEERKVLWKLDLFLMPLLVLGFFVLQLDRSNISNALTDTLTEDLGISTDDVNLGNQLMLAGIIIAEIPSNIMLQKVGAPVWLTGQMGIWGTVALTQAWCTDIHSFYATRFLLGIFEGGYIPGAQYMLSLFYTRRELALRTAIFYFGNYFAAATGSLIAAGILNLGGVKGLSGWQWLFVIEGIITLAAFVVFILLLPKSPSFTKPIHQLWDVFSEREREVLQARIKADDPSKSAAKAHITWARLKEAAMDVRLWLHLILNLVSLAPKGGLGLYGPTVIKNLGFSKTRANALNSVSSFLVVVLSFLISYASDATRLRGPWCTVAFCWSMAFAGALYGLPLSADRWTRYAIFTLLSGGNALAQGLNDAWLSINAGTPHKRSIGLAFVVIGSNLGGLAGQQLFRTSDAPRYNRAFLAILLLYAASVAVTCVIMWLYWSGNKKAAKKERTATDRESGSSQRDDAEQHRYQL